MTDEEKKAIDKLKRSANYFVMPIYETKIILELIEKQSKEIESLKEDKEIIKRKYEDLVDENEKFLYDSAVYLMGKDDTDSKWNDKIKAKIEESELLIDNSQGCMSDEDLYKEYGKIEFGQSLLEKE